MEIYTLVGKSGTGKSFHAMEICKEKNIDAIIDDGLFIYKNTLVAGLSAKRADTKIGAVKVALFIDDEACMQIKLAIKAKNPKKILILGTSDGMVDKIAQRLGLTVLPEDSPNRIRIEDITTEEERKTARQQRDKLGKHVIPAPSLQLKHNFAGYFMDPLRILRGKDQGAAAERTVVRPTYSYMGEYFVAEKVIDDIVYCVGGRLPYIDRIAYVGHVPVPEAYQLMITLKLRRGYPIWESAEDFQRRVSEMVESMTAFNVTAVDVEVRGIN